MFRTPRCVARNAYLFGCQHPSPLLTLPSTLDRGFSWDQCFCSSDVVPDTVGSSIHPRCMVCTMLQRPCSGRPPLHSSTRAFQATIAIRFAQDHSMLARVFGLPLSSEHECWTAVWRGVVGQDAVPWSQGSALRCIADWKRLPCLFCSASWEASHPPALVCGWSWQAL